MRKGHKKLFRKTPGVFSSTMAKKLEAFEEVRLQLWSLKKDWKTHVDAILEESRTSVGLGEELAKCLEGTPVEPMQSKQSLEALALLVEATRVESERTKDLATELNVMYEEMNDFMEREVKELEKLFEVLERNGKQLKKKKKKGDAAEVEAEEATYVSMTENVERQALKVCKRWDKLSFAIVQWFLTAKLSSFKDRHALLRARQNRMPEEADEPEPSPRGVSGKRFSVVTPDVTYVEAQHIEHITPTPSYIRRAK